jgi:hypothetical protein
LGLNAKYSEQLVAYSFVSYVTMTDEGEYSKRAAFFSYDEQLISHYQQIPSESITNGGADYSIEDWGSGGGGGGDGG